MKPPGATKLAVGIDHPNNLRLAWKTLKQIALGRTTFMDAPFSMDGKQEMSKGERETGPLTKAILNPLWVLWKDFAKGGQDSHLRPTSPEILPTR
jgi:hypothetical protein